MIHDQDICPICAQKFSREDDVVYCPECGTPHHRACWQQNGGCANARLHGEGFVWQSSAPETETEPVGKGQTVCPRCGEACAADALVCPSCGKRFGVIPPGQRDAQSGKPGFDFNGDFFMRGVAEEPDRDLGGVTVRDAAMYTQYRTPDYVRKFTRCAEGKKAGWNWAAFFFSPFWFFYRKAYKAGALFLGLMMVLGVFAAIPLSRVQDNAMQIVRKHITIDETSSYEQITSDLASLQGEALQEVQGALLRYAESIVVYSAVLFVPNLFAAVFADFLYKQKVVKDVKSMHEFTDDDRTFRMLILRRGGVSILGLALCYMLMSLFFNFVFYLQ